MNSATPTYRNDQMPKRITKALLKRLRACESGIAAFAVVFPRGVALTPEALQIAFDADLGLSYLAYILGCYRDTDYAAISALHWQCVEGEITDKAKWRGGRRVGRDAILRMLEAQK